jgi:hypothetical protein
MTITWRKVEGGLYVSECGTWKITKTYSRSGWRVFNNLTKFYGYEPTLEKAKRFAVYNAGK